MGSDLLKSIERIAPRRKDVMLDTTISKICKLLFQGTKKGISLISSLEENLYFFDLFELFPPIYKLVDHSFNLLIGKVIVLMACTLIMRNAYRIDKIKNTKYEIRYAKDNPTAPLSLKTNAQTRKTVAHIAFSKRAFHIFPILAIPDPIIVAVEEKIAVTQIKINTIFPFAKDFP